MLGNTHDFILDGKNPIDNGRLVRARHRFYARTTSILSRAADGALSPIRVK